MLFLLIPFLLHQVNLKEMFLILLVLDWMLKLSIFSLSKDFQNSRLLKTRNWQFFSLDCEYFFLNLRSSACEKTYLALKTIRLEDAAVQKWVRRGLSWSRCRSSRPNDIAAGWWSGAMAPTRRYRCVAHQRRATVKVDSWQLTCTLPQVLHLLMQLAA